MTCPNLGKSASVKKNGNKVARMTSLAITINNGNQDVTEFGDDWEFFCQTIQNWTATIEGYFDRSNTYQNVLHNVATSAGEMTDIEFWEDDTNYWTPDTATDSDASAIIESYTWNADPSSIVTFSMTVKGNGPIHRTS